jgi:AmiR/NasT family two-component response regulator
MDEQRSAFATMMAVLYRRRTRGQAIGITMERRDTSPAGAEAYIRNVALILQTSVDDVASRILGCRGQ